MNLNNLIYNRAMWHKSCSLRFADSKVQRAVLNSCNPKTPDRTTKIHGEVSPSIQLEDFTKLLDFIQNKLDRGQKNFKMTDFIKSTRTDDNLQTIHTTRLKQAVLNHFKGLFVDHLIGKWTYLIHRDEFSEILREGIEERISIENNLTIAKAAKKIIKDILNHTCEQFMGNFDKNCQTAFIPESLKLFQNCFTRSKGNDVAS
eukprot:Pompholyxophrys_sp_v1_NODE_11_length_5290_cov_18.520778.p4 type:complete len:202 gc:universal NODE_11_length_5290_cov_18.520778:676-1281(+)